MSRKFPIWIAAILIVSSILLGVGYVGIKKVQNLEAIVESIAKEFPDVEHISTSTLASLMEAEDENELLLIDCRNPEEFAISRIPGAVNLRDVEAVQGALENALVKMENPPEKIAIYCSVGYRSSKLARALDEAGIENAVNIRGSIFAWTNEDRPLETPDGEPAETVHPYNQFWGRLLNEGKQASLNPNSEIE